MKRLLLALMGFFYVLSVQAETIAATPTGGKYWYSQMYCSQAPARPACDATTKDSWDTATLDAFNKKTAGVSWTILSKSPASEPALATSNVTPAWTARRTSDGYEGTIFLGAMVGAAAVYTCPSGQNWTLTGQTCTRPDCASGETRNDQGVCESPCKAGQTRVNGVCTCDSGAQTGTDGTCCPVAGSGGGAPMQWCYVDSASASTCDSAGTNGCKVRCNNVTYQKGTGNTVQVYPKMALGQNCSYTGTRGTNLGGGPLNDGELKQVSDATKDPAKAKTPEGCMAAGMGYVQSASGTTCVPSGDTGVVKKESATNTTNDNGQQTTETKTKETSSTPTGGETKETTVKANPDGTTTTTTKTTTCKEDGTCTTATTETTKDANGNTVGNKASTNQQSASEFCKANPDSEMCKGASDACKDHPDRLGCMGAGDATEQPDLSTTEKGITAITPFNISSNASCPADLPLPKGMSFSFQPFCDYASAFRPIILALAWITAGFLAFGYRGNNG